MASIDRFLQRNKDFAATGAHEGASIIARHQVCVITCRIPGPTRQPSSNWTSATRWWSATRAAASQPTC